MRITQWISTKNRSMKQENVSATALLVLMMVVRLRRTAFVAYFFARICCAYLISAGAAAAAEAGINKASLCRPACMFSTIYFLCSSYLVSFFCEYFGMRH